MYEKFSTKKEAITDPITQKLLQKTVFKYECNWTDIAQAVVLWDDFAFPIIATTHATKRTGERCHTSYTQNILGELVDIIEGCTGLQDIIGSVSKQQDLIIYSEKYERAYILILKNDAIGLKTVVTREKNGAFHVGDTAAVYVNKHGQLEENTFFISHK